ncbi:E3 ubiquitin-protein ligase MBR2 [Linum grandiflorum]
MGDRHFSNASNFFERDRGWGERDVAAGRSFIYTGRAVTPESVSYLYPSGNILRSGLNCGSQHTWGSGSVEHLSTNRSEGPQVHGHLSASYDTLPQFASEGSFHLEPDANTNASSSIYNGQTMHEANGGLIDYPAGTGRGRFKRKVPGFIPPCATGATTGFYGAGSSSHPNGLQLGTPPDYRPFPSNSFHLPPHGGGSLTIGGEDSGSNARSITDSDPNPTRTYFQSYTPGPNGSTAHLPQNHHGAVNIHGLNNNAPTYGQNHIGISPPAHVGFQISANNTLTHEMNPYYAGGNAADSSRYQHLHESILSRNPIPAPQYFHGLHALAANEDQANYYQRAIPSQRTDAISLHPGQGPAIPGMIQPIVSESFPSRSARPFLTRGLHHNHREGRSRMALERLQARSNAVDMHDRMGGEASMMLDGPYAYGHRNMYDQYGDMRLDIDNMSYEELLALGDSIGNVNTGLSDNLISECLLEKKHSTSDKNLEDSCAICLEEYKKGSRIGKLRKCGHEYHMGCIKKWLTVKNSCPICKGPAAAIPNDQV